MDKIIEEDRNGRTVCEAQGIYCLVRSFTFILAFVVLFDLLLHTKLLSDYLQKQDLDFVSAMEMLASTLTVLQEKRSETHFNEYYSIAEEKCTELGIMEQELPPPKHIRVSSKITDTSSVKHSHLGKDKYRI